MIVGIGCDVAEFSVAEKFNWQSDQNQRSRIFSPYELLQYDKQKRLSYLTGRFAAKEAVLKCLGTGMYDGISMKNIEIIQEENGKPSIKLTGEVLKKSIDLGIKKWLVSISHTLKNSTAFVIAEN
ncbi:holo-ACP synthase [Allomuricauda sp.]|uniref:holo-ACP synthase n=1 Tax=Flagellimonas alginolytica TaxID=3177515 RepID=UPI0025DC2483|nr:holo-ACP synthase [Allomuricauda sp.]